MLPQAEFEALVRNLDATIAPRLDDWARSKQSFGHS